MSAFRIYAGMFPFGEPLGFIPHEQPNAGMGPKCKTVPFHLIPLPSKPLDQNPHSNRGLTCSFVTATIVIGSIDNIGCAITFHFKSGARSILYTCRVMNRRMTSILACTPVSYLIFNWLSLVNQNPCPLDLGGNEHVVKIKFPQG
jgi:hypothetical protein